MKSAKDNLWEAIVEYERFAGRREAVKYLEIVLHVLRQAYEKTKKETDRKIR